jgi:hypothetical protein
MYKIIDKINENDEYDEEENRLDNEAINADASKLASNTSSKIPIEQETLSFNGLILDDVYNSEKV